MNLLKKIDEIRKSNVKAALCIIVQTKGSTPRCEGAKMIVLEDGRIAGTIGGGNLEKKVIQNAIGQIKKNRSGLFDHDLLHQHSMCCGGSVKIYIEPIRKMKSLLIFGAGHTAEALVKLAAPLDFNIYIIDDRKDYLNTIQSPEVNKLCLHYKDALPKLPFDDETFITIMTYEHSYDRDILSYCINKPHAYLGMIGSQRKVELTKKMFLEANLCSNDKLSQIDMPMGLNINAEGPQEIAISIMAKLIAIKNN